MIISKEVQHHEDVEKFVYFNKDGNFVGRFSINQERIWDVLVFKRFRGNGYCVTMLREFFDKFPGEYFLYVAKKNIPARKSYEKLGFEYVDNSDIDFIGMAEMKIKIN